MYPPPSATACMLLSPAACLLLQVIELDAAQPGPHVLEYDEEWLAIMRSTHHLVNLRSGHMPLPGMGALRQVRTHACVCVHVLVWRGRGALRQVCTHACVCACVCACVWGPMLLPW